MDHITVNTWLLQYYPDDVHLGFPTMEELLLAWALTFEGASAPITFPTTGKVMNIMNDWIHVEGHDSSCGVTVCGEPDGYKFALLWDGFLFI